MMILYFQFPFKHQLMDYLNVPLVLSVATITGALLFAYLRKPKKQTTQTLQNQTKNIQFNLQQSSEKPSQKEEVQSPTKTKKTKPKKKKQPKQTQQQSNPIKTQKEIEQTYAEIFYGSINLKPQQNSIYGPACISYRNSKILVGTTKNELVLYDLKKWKKDDPKSLEKYFVSLDNNTPTAVFIGSKFYYVALGFDKTIAYYEFVGEKGVYFQEVKRFFRNILKSDASEIYVPESEKFIITAGSQADTTLNVWSMKGEKLHTFNTYQIEHYDIRSAQNLIMVRGWTSEVKIFNVQTDKTGGFTKIEKGQHLSIPDQPLCSSIDNLALYGLTVSKQFKMILWDLNPQNPTKSELKVSQPYEVDMDEVELCLVHTLKNENQRYKTLIILSDKNKIRICDKNFNILQTINGIDCKQMEMVGSMKNAVLITQTKQDKLIVWNLTKIVQKMDEYSL